MGSGFSEANRRAMLAFSRALRFLPLGGSGTGKSTFIRLLLRAFRRLREETAIFSSNSATSATRITTEVRLARELRLLDFPGLERAVMDCLKVDFVNMTREIEALEADGEEVDEVLKARYDMRVRYRRLLKRFADGQMRSGSFYDWLRDTLVDKVDMRPCPWPAASEEHEVHGFIIIASLHTFGAQLHVTGQGTDARPYALPEPVELDSASPLIDLLKQLRYQFLDCTQVNERLCHVVFMGLDQIRKHAACHEGNPDSRLQDAPARIKAFKKLCEDQIATGFVHFLDGSPEAMDTVAAQMDAVRVFSKIVDATDFAVAKEVAARADMELDYLDDE